MAASMWRMNGLSRSIAGLLVLCTLLLSHAEADPTNATGTPAPSGYPASSDTNLTTAVGGGGRASDNASVTPANSFPATIIVFNSQDWGASGTTVPVPVKEDGKSAVTEVPVEPKNLVVPEVNCVTKDKIPENTAVKAIVETADCEATKRIIQETAAPWCDKKNCTLEIFQDGNTVSVVSDDATHHILASALQSEHLKDKLRLTKVETPSSSGSSVFVGILVTGLLAAIAITVGYFKCQRKPNAKGVKLPEKPVFFEVDQENQGNTLVSVAPLNPPPETTEKPSVNGESPEAVKTESPPPTNGHSSAKTADTEL